METTRTRECLVASQGESRRHCQRGFKQLSPADTTQKTGQRIKFFPLVSPYRNRGRLIGTDMIGADMIGERTFREVCGEHYFIITCNRIIIYLDR